MGYVERYAEICQLKNRPFVIVEGQLFALNDHWISPIGPADQRYHLSKEQCRGLLQKVSGLLIVWTDGFGHANLNPDWYALICRQHNPIEQVRDRKRRQEFHRALSACEVCKVDAEVIASQGYETYCEALRSYRNFQATDVSKEEFERRVRSDGPFGDCLHQWAAFSGNKLIAFAQNLVYDNLCVDYALMRLHPNYLRDYPGYALFYKMNEYYLAQMCFQYANAGFRNIYHDTDIQTFLIRKFGFEKVGTGLHVHFRTPFGQLVRIAYPLRRQIAQFYPRARPIFELARLASTVNIYQ